MSRDELISIYSDLHKDVNGFRPRNTVFLTDEEIEERIEMLQDRFYLERLDWEREMEEMEERLQEIEFENSIYSDALARFTGELENAGSEPDEFEDSPCRERSRIHLDMFAEERRNIRRFFRSDRNWKRYRRFQSRSVDRTIHGPDDLYGGYDPKTVNGDYPPFPCRAWAISVGRGCSLPTRKVYRKG